MSKVETLKLATWYISFLNEMITTGRNPNENAKKTQQKTRKVVIKCHRTGLDSGVKVPVLMHSLSCQFEDNPYRQGNIISTKLWTPEDPRTDNRKSPFLSQECGHYSKEDCSNLSSHRHKCADLSELKNHFSLDSTNESFSKT